MVWHYSFICLLPGSPFSLSDQTLRRSLDTRLCLYLLVCAGPLDLCDHCHVRQQFYHYSADMGFASLASTQYAEPLILPHAVLSATSKHFCSLKTICEPKWPGSQTSPQRLHNAQSWWPVENPGTYNYSTRFTQLCCFRNEGRVYGSGRGLFPKHFRKVCTPSIGMQSSC